ncbi:MAG: class I SAM-dependent methyltransferase [Saprospirales bacterium]|nr:MAG: class I SAM-dependent methyltransferase [Saprospirales bacterium]
MLSKSQQRILRSRIFRHLDGIAVAFSAHALKQKGVLDYLLERGKCEISELTEKFQANEGYLNVGLRSLASQGWLKREVDNQTNRIELTINKKSPIAFELIEFYGEAIKFLKEHHSLSPDKLSTESKQQFFKLLTSIEKDFHLPPPKNEHEREVREQIRTHIEGNLAGPLTVMLAMGGMFHKYFMEASFSPDEYHEDAHSFEQILDFFTRLGWFNKGNATFQFTDEGLFFAKRASAYGVTVSYLPTFRKVDELIFGNPEILVSQAGEEEKHVDREMNVWGSGGAHSAYFKKVDEIIIDLFNRPINEQPKGVLDMGCGNGAFLIHIFDVIEQRTYRGKILDQHPLLLVGADYNQSALKVTRANLIKSDIWAKVVWGDIGDPDQLASNLRQDYGIEMEELLNVRTFLDHNRIWKNPLHTTDRISSSSGAFAYRGKRLNNNLVEDSLLEHFKNWAPFIHRFGLLVIELHTLPSELTAANPGRTPATAYDATHGFSDQYILEAEVFIRIAEEAGLQRDERLKARFPDSELATISVNLLKG